MVLRGGQHEKVTVELKSVCVAPACMGRDPAQKR